MSEKDLCTLKYYQSGFIIIRWQCAIGLGGKKWHIIHNSIVKLAANQAVFSVAAATQMFHARPWESNLPERFLQNGSSPALFPPPCVTDMGNFPM